MEDRLSDFVRTELTKAADVMRAMLGDAALLDGVRDVAQACTKSLRDGGKIMFCGNGGSAADSQHLAAELVGTLQVARGPLPAVALTTDTSALTAIGNDFGYEHVFARQVEALGRPGDVLVGITTSGRSKNVLAALEAARARGVATVGMTGHGAGSADLEAVADYCLRVPSAETHKIQEGHIVLGHIVCGLIETALFRQRGARSTES